MENWKNFVTEEEDTDNDGLADSDEVAAVDPQDPKSLILGIIMSRVQQLMQGEKMLTRVQTLNELPPLDNETLKTLASDEFKKTIDKHIDDIAYQVREFWT